MTCCRQTPGVFVKLLGSFRTTFCCPKTDYPYSRIFPYSLQTNILLGKVKVKVVLVTNATPRKHMKGCGSKTPRVLNLESRWERLVSIILRHIFQRSTEQEAGGSQSWSKRMDEDKSHLRSRQSTLKIVEVFPNLVGIISLWFIMVQSFYTKLKYSFYSFLKNGSPYR